MLSIIYRVSDCGCRHEIPVTSEPIEVVENDGEVVVVNKPSSIPVHPCGRYRHNSITFILASEHGLLNLRSRSQRRCAFSPSSLTSALLSAVDRLMSGLCSSLLTSAPVPWPLPSLQRSTASTASRPASSSSRSRNSERSRFRPTSSIGGSRRSTSVASLATSQGQWCPKSHL